MRHDVIKFRPGSGGRVWDREIFLDENVISWVGLALCVFTIHDVLYDGNCMLSAIVYQLNSSNICDFDSNANSS